jgi:hypothetical protein
LLDWTVSVNETSVCIVDDSGEIVREVKVASEPEALLPVLKNPAYRFKRIGLEAGPLWQWLFSALAEAELPVICVETQHMQAVLKALVNKTDRNDGRGISQMMRAGFYRPVHVKTLRSQKLRMLLTHRKLLQSKAIAIDNDLRGTLRNFGLKVGMVGTVKFEARIRELVENLPDLAALRPSATAQKKGPSKGETGTEVTHYSSGLTLTQRAYSDLRQDLDGAVAAQRRMIFRAARFKYHRPAQFPAVCFPLLPRRSTQASRPAVPM